MKMFIYVSSMIFKSFIDLEKSRCDVPNGITQGWACPTFNINLYKIVSIGKNILQNNNFMLKLRCQLFKFFTWVILSFTIHN
jgi:hypothetical protein